MKHLTINKSCRICKGTKFTKVFSFGPQPPANAFLTKEKLKEHEQLYPLDVYFCHTCALLQLRDIVDPEILFGNYVYVSSTSPVFIKHFEEYATQVIDILKLPKKSLVIDIGSNDGILLHPFKSKGMNVLGIEPARDIAESAKKSGIETIAEFFTTEVAEEIRSIHGPAAVITANNVFAHINDLDEVLSGVQMLLGVNGVFIIEAPYLVDFLENNLFDTVYHEHLSYLSIGPLQRLFSRFGMHISHVEHVESHGGSIRVYATRTTSSFSVHASVKKFLQKEQSMKLGTLTPYRAFNTRVAKNKKALVELLKKLKKENQKIVGYGAPAKGNTLLNYFGINTKYLDYIIDDSPYKQSLYTPGTHIPVVSSEELPKDKPDYVLILAWNFATPIMEKLKVFKKSGGHFILPVPKPQIK